MDYIDERGPYVLEQASNADLRNRRSSGPVRAVSMARYWADSLFVSQYGDHAFVPLGKGDRIVFFPHEGEGEPTPITDDAPQES